MSYTIELNEIDLGQIVGGLEQRAEAWEKTAEYLRTGSCSDASVIEECASAGEAERIAKHYRTIIINIEVQRLEQR